MSGFYKLMLLSVGLIALLICLVSTSILTETKAETSKPEINFEFEYAMPSGYKVYSLDIKNRETIYLVIDSTANITIWPSSLTKP